MSGAEFIELADKLGVVALLLLIMVGGARRWWVFGWTYNDLSTQHETLRGEKNEWKELALRSTNLAESLNELRKAGRIGP